jgi:protein ImuA
MPVPKTHIISRLKQEILLLQGFKPAPASFNNGGLDLIKYSFPNASFPTGAVHEFISTTNEDATASLGFISGIVASLMKNGAPAVWISPRKWTFPPALKAFGLRPHHIIFIQAKKPVEILWAIEEALETDSFSAVIGDSKEISFLESRRLQLAVEQSKVTAFLLRRNPKNLATASVTRWRIKPLPTGKKDLPGIGFPKWNVELLKVRNGKPGQWQMQWHNERFELVQQSIITYEEQQRKIV